MQGTRQEQVNTRKENNEYDFRGYVGFDEVKLG